MPLFCTTTRKRSLKHTKASMQSFSLRWLGHVEDRQPLLLPHTSRRLGATGRSRGGGCSFLWACRLDAEDSDRRLGFAFLPLRKAPSRRTAAYHSSKEN